MPNRKTNIMPDKHTLQDRLEEFKKLSPEQIKELVQEVETELSDEELEYVSGGSAWDDLVYTKCPKCGSDNVSIVGEHILSCKDCNYYGSY